MRQIFHLVPVTTTVRVIKELDTQMECASECHHVITVVTGRLWWFHAGGDATDGSQFQRRAFCSFACSLATMQPQNMNQA
jgi:hypothetical protein